MIVEQISMRLALPVSYLWKLATTASHRYKQYTIPKRTGGTRTIHHPARELKLLQRWLLQNVLCDLPVHVAATAYSKETTIRRNAEIHVANNYILRVDFQDFFPSLKGSDVMAVMGVNRKKLANGEVTDGDLEFVRMIVCRFDCLTIGAPTSPQLSNAIMFEFDEAWSNRARDLEVAYTRYADDLYFSTNQPNVLREVLDGIRKDLSARQSPALRINDKKTSFSSRKRRRISAGLVLTSDRKISIGRQKKRMLKALVNQLRNKQLEPEQIAHLRGWIAYMRSIEPAFVLALARKYDLDFDSHLTWEV
ncbi:MAG TPA: retron St85 family RNA-directed DNA polymerase [Pyrinomonadaceae bacterium]|nr:retron St85 family RNA-directed DNA polymerase [Pyrinomonadaceae bacterium]